MLVDRTEIKNVDDTSRDRQHGELCPVHEVLPRIYQPHLLNTSHRLEHLGT